MEENNNFLEIDESAGKKNRQTGVVLVLAIAIVVLAIVLTVVLVKAIVGIAKTEETTIYELTTNNQVISTTDEDYVNQILGINTMQSSDDSVDDTVSQNEEDVTVDEDIIKDTTKNQIIESYEQLPVNGENQLSDNKDNEFIKLVSDKYGVDTDLLVAIYSVPDSGTNFVLQFSGDKKRGEYVKSPDTLEKVYQIDKERNVKVATGGAVGNEGVSYAESVMCVAMVKKIVMAQYPQYFTGLE